MVPDCVAFNIPPGEIIRYEKQLENERHTDWTLGLLATKALIFHSFGNLSSSGGIFGSILLGAFKNSENPWQIIL